MNDLTQRTKTWDAFNLNWVDLKKELSFEIRQTMRMLFEMSIDFQNFSFEKNYFWGICQEKHTEKSFKSFPWLLWEKSKHSSLSKESFVFLKKYSQFAFFHFAQFFKNWRSLCIFLEFPIHHSWPTFLLMATGNISFYFYSKIFPLIPILDRTPRRTAQEVVLFNESPSFSGSPTFPNSFFLIFLPFLISVMYWGSQVAKLTKQPEKSVDKNLHPLSVSYSILISQNSDS